MTASSRRLDSTRSWAVVAVSFASLFGVWGTVFTFTVYADALAAAFGLSGVQTATVFSVGVAVTFLAGAVAGLFAARLPVRAVMAAAAGFMAVGSWFTAAATGYPGAVAGFALVGTATGTVFVLVLSVVPQWFEAYEGRAMGLTVVGSGLGVQVMPFVWLWLLDRVPFRTAFPAVGTAVALVLTGAVVVMTRPGPLGETGLVDRAWLRSFFRRRRAWLAFLGVVFGWAWYFVLSGNAVGILTAEGVPRTVAAGAFGLIGGVSIASRIGSGALADRYGYRPVVVAGLAMTTVGLLLLPLAAARPVMYLSLGAFGVGLGVLAALYPPALIHGFDPHHPSAVVGVFQFATATAGLVAPIGMSVTVGLTGGYGLPLSVLAVVTLAGAVLFWVGTDPSGPPVGAGPSRG